MTFTIDSIVIEFKILFKYTNSWFYHVSNKNLKLRIFLLIIGVIIIALFIKFGKLTPVSSLQQNETFPNEIPFKTLVQGKNSEFIQNQTLIITNSIELSSIWEKMFPSQTISSTTQFNKKNIIAAFQGQKTLSGYSIEIYQIIQHSDYVEITVKEKSPGEKCIVATLLTSPYHIVETDIIKKEIKFKSIQEIIECE